MALSGLLAAVALLANSVPILIGSMIIAPALAPLALVAFALVGGQPRLALYGLVVGLVGILVATIVAVLTTWVMNVTGVIPADTNLLDKPLLEERVRPGWYSLAAAIAAGVVGTAALARNKTDTLVGTVAALALDRDRFRTARSGRRGDGRRRDAPRQVWSSQRCTPRLPSPSAAVTSRSRTRATQGASRRTAPPESSR